MILSPLWAHFKWLFLQKCTDLHVLYFLWQLTPHIDSTFFTWPTMSYRTVKGKMPLFTAQPSPKSCVTLSHWSSESFLLKPSNVQWKCWSRSMFHNCLYMYITRKRFVFWGIIFCFLFSQDGDQKVIKSLERILSIWEDRGVYSGTLISELRSSLVKEESPVETPVEQKSEH